MIAVFYDRKNRQTVRSDQLRWTNVIAEVIQGDHQESSMLTKPLNELLKEELLEDNQTVGPGLLSWHRIQIGEVGYKSKDCPSYMNHDMYCMQSDLVFLELVPDGKDR